MSRARKPQLAVVPDPVEPDTQADVAEIPEEPIDPHTDALTTYEEAERRARAIRAAWEREECPLLTAGSMGQTVPHPLVKMVETAEAHASKLRQALEKRRRGPAPKGVVNASIGASPAARLRAKR